MGREPVERLVGRRPAVPQPRLRSHPSRPRPPGASGGTTFHFVTDGIESALAQAKNAAAGKDVSLGGGADVAQQYLAAGLIDEMLISVVPLFLGAGSRLFDSLGDAMLDLEQVEAVEAPGVAHLRYRVSRG